MKLLRNIFIVLILLFVRMNHGIAQLCPGSLGDPVVNISFGSGLYFGNPLAAAATSYVFQQSYCPFDGYYSVVNQTSLCYSGTWHTLLQDHTGNENGYFMLVNASY